MGSNRPTMKDVAKLAGVSFKTVSRVVNGQEGVREELRERVRRAVGELGYVVNYSARSLASARVRTIGVMIPHITDPHSFELAYHVGEICEAQKVGVIILTRPILSDGITINNVVGHGLVGALLLVAPGSLEPFLPGVRAMGVPTVVIETPSVDTHGRPVTAALPCIASDNLQGGRDGTRYLLELGHRRIAFIGGPATSPQAQLRLLGYQDAHAAQGIACPESYVRPGRWTWDSGYAEARCLLALESRPTALFCASDSIALGAMRAVHDCGLRVPDDVSILGFDDISAAAQSTPPLTTMQQPSLAMVQQAVDLLLDALYGGPLPCESRLLPTTLQVRASCAPPAPSIVH
ncbi:MAG: LacI family DNA-binding transcriptional regulator [Anaerolineae bacterium]